MDQEVDAQKGTKRFCVDYRKVNEATIKDAYPLPSVDDSLEHIAGNKLFSCLDMNSGYWQVEVDERITKRQRFVVEGVN